MPTSSTSNDVAHALVLTWNGAHLLGDCLRALLPQAARVTVVDNASTDGTAELLRREFPRVEHLILSGNFGFGRANNEGIRLALDAGAEFVALLNNDVEVAPGWLDRLLAAARARPRAGLFTGTLLFRGGAGFAGDGRSPKGGAPEGGAGFAGDGRSPKGGAPEGEVVNSTGLDLDALGRARDRDFRVPLAALRRGDGPVAGVSGGAALLRASMLREVGLFDPAYFAYYEDVDLSLRAARAGWESWYVRDAVARHRFGASFGPGSPRQRYLLGRGHLRTLALHQPLAKAAALIPATIAYRTLFKAPLELVRGRPALALAELRAAGGGAFEAARALIDRSRSRPSLPIPGSRSTARDR